MKIKKFNELFDNSDLKAEFEIPYIDGSLKKNITKWDSIGKGRNLFVEKLTYHCPFLKGMGWQESGNITTFKFDDTLNDNTFIYYNIDISTKSNDTYFYTLVAKAIRSDNVIYSKRYNSGIIDFENLSKSLNKEAFGVLGDFGKWLNSNLKYNGIRNVPDIAPIRSDQN